ncbi:hypothetical protein Tco_0386557 [Tanacetum coccineum]
MVSFRQLHSPLTASFIKQRNYKDSDPFESAFHNVHGRHSLIGSMASFKVLETQFQMFIKSQMYMDDDIVVMTCNYFLQYTQLEIPGIPVEHTDQHMESVEESIE